MLDKKRINELVVRWQKRKADLLALYNKRKKNAKIVKAISSIVLKTMNAVLSDYYYKAKRKYAKNQVHSLKKEVPNFLLTSCIQPERELSTFHNGNVSNEEKSLVFNYYPSNEQMKALIFKMAKLNL